MGHPIMFDDADPLLAKVRELALGFPDAAEKISHGRPSFFTTKVFAHYGGSRKTPEGLERHDHALLVLPGEEERAALLAAGRAFVPAYVGHAGWIGVDLTEATDWAEIGELLDASYRRTAGPRRVARLT
jgi:predicted DNA-binding protein (MmcQ/YjbR family)